MSRSNLLISLLMTVFLTGCWSPGGKDGAASDTQVYTRSITTAQWGGVTNETSMDRTILFSVRVQLLYALTNNRVAQKTFLVAQDDQPFAEQPVTTTSDGFLSIAGRMSHRVYTREQLVPVSFLLRDPSLCERGDARNRATRCPDVRVNLMCNPNDQTATMCVDQINPVSTALETQVQATDAQAPSIMIRNYSYYTIGFNYELDEFLNLKVIKQVLLTIEPKVVRYDSIRLGRENRSTPLRDGIYLLKVAMEKSYMDPAARGVYIDRERNSDTGQYQNIIRANSEMRTRNFITVIKKLVRVQDGVIITPIEFRMRDLRLMRIRSNLHIQIEPIDERLLTQTLSVVQQENTAHPQSSGQGNQTFSTLREFLTQRMRQATQGAGSTTQSDLSTFMRERGLTAAQVEEDGLRSFSSQAMRANIDYDMFIDRSSSLRKRTFIGPITLIASTMSANMRPTDMLDTDFCEDSADCNQLSDLESSTGSTSRGTDNLRYFQSLRGFANRNVDDLIREKIQQEIMFYQEQAIGSLISNYARSMNLKFISLGRESMKSFRENCVIQPNTAVTLNAENWSQNLAQSFERCLIPDAVNQIQLQSFLSRLNEQQPRNRTNLTANDLRQLIDEGEMSDLLARRLCRYWVQEVWSDLQQDNRLRGRMRSVAQYCNNNRGHAFSIDRKLRVKEIGSHRYRGGKSFNINVGSQFTISRQESTSYQTSVGIDPLGLPIIKDILSNPGRGGLNINSQVSRARGEGTSISEQTFLAVQTAALDVELKKYERCAIVRINPDVVIKRTRFDRRATQAVGVERASQSLTRSLMLCKGQDETRTMPVRERYFYFTQHFTEGDMLDSADLYNHPWLLALRGVRDFRTFLLLIQRQDDSLSVGSIFRQLQAQFFPLGQLERAYREQLPSFPGMYTVPSDRNEVVGPGDYPFPRDPQASIDTELREIGIGVDGLNVPLATEHEIRSQ